jgi:hypothetical protein
MLDLHKYLSHSAEIVAYDTSHVGPRDVWNRSSNYEGDPVPTDCFCYFGSNELVLDTMVGIPRMAFSAPTKWQIILPRKYVNLIHVKDRVQNIVEKDTKASVRQDGYIQEYKVYRHHRHGAMFILAVLNDGDEIT